MSYQLHCGDCLEIMPTLEADSIDTIITDPPAGVAFMGKAWDSHSRYAPRTEKGQSTLNALTILALEPWAAGFVAFTVDWAIEALRVLKPGAPGLVWALPRTSDLTGLGLRLAGFEVKENLYHLFGSGFPKSMALDKAIDAHLGKSAEREVIGTKPPNTILLAKAKQPGWDRPWMHDTGAIERSQQITAPATDAARQWAGYGTALKPSVEEWILVMKPLDGTYAANALKWNVSGLNIDGCRISANGEDLSRPIGYGGIGAQQLKNIPPGTRNENHPAGRWPANLILDQSAAALLDEMSGELTSGARKGPNPNATTALADAYAGGWKQTGGACEGSTGGASRYFTVLPDEQTRFLYTAKAGSKERSTGLEGLDRKVQLRSDLTEEQRLWVYRELEKAGVDTSL